MIPAEVRALAEDQKTQATLWPTASLLPREGYSLWFGPAYYPGLVIVHRVRTDDVRAIVEDVRMVLRERGLHRAMWEVGPSTLPADVGAQLEACGLTADDEVNVALALDHEPDGVSDGIEVRRAETYEDFEDFYRVQHVAFGNDPATFEEGRKHLATAFELVHRAPHLETYLGYLDGEPVSTGRATFAPAAVALNGGSTLPRARGRGAYRAVVAARWRDAVDRGVPYLVTQARPTSLPILRRMGFEDVCEIQNYVDEF